VGFHRAVYLLILSYREFLRARKGDTRCKDYIPRFPVAGLA
jgi:hypothetical protein